MRFDFQLLVTILVMSTAFQIGTILIQSIIMKKKTSIIWWVTSYVFSIYGYVILAQANFMTTAPIFIFIGALLFALSDVIRIFGVEREFVGTKDTLFAQLRLKKFPYYLITLSFFVISLFVVIFILKIYHQAILLMYFFKLFSGAFGFCILHWYRGKGLFLSKVLLSIVYVLTILGNAYFLVCLYGSTFNLIPFGLHQSRVYTTELLLTIVWTTSILTLNVNHVENERHKTQHKYQAIFDLNPDLQIIVKEEDLTIIDVNQSFLETTKLNRDEMIGVTVEQSGILKYIPDLEFYYQTIKENKLKSSFEIAGVIDSGEEFVALLDTNRITLDGERVLVNSIKNVSETKRYKRFLTIYEDAVRQNPIAMVITDLDGKVQFVNKQFTRMSGFELEDIIGKTPRLLKSGHHDAAFYADLWHTISSGNEWYSEMLNRRKDGILYWEKNRIIPVKDENEKIVAFVSMKEDVTEVRNKTSLLERRASLDGLTGLYNRGYFMEYFKNVLKELKEDGQGDCAFLMVDIDDFKLINDTHGHNFADKVLMEISQMFLRSLRKRDLVGRIGGEEFGLILSNVDQERMRLASERIRTQIERMDFVNEKGESVRVTVSIGAHLFNGDDSIENITYRADQAMYQSKNNGKNQVTVSNG